jgi:diadenosine tetraphosphate (Ap4A) HIT family hydrolase
VHTRSRARLVERVARVQPEHVHIHIIPQREGHDMTAVEGLAHACSATFRLVVVHVAKERFLVCAEAVSDRIVVIMPE